MIADYIMWAFIVMNLVMIGEICGKWGQEKERRIYGWLDIIGSIIAIIIYLMVVYRI